MVVDVKAPKLYPGGAHFVKYSADGGSFAYYPSGRMAAAFERMGAGFYCYFYADDNAGTTLMAMDPSGCGYCAFPNGKPRLTSQKTGGTFSGEDGNIIRLWNTMKPLAKDRPISFELSQNIVITFGSRQHIKAKLSCQGLVEDYQLGEVPKMASDNYLGKVIGQIKMGPERGKYVLDVDACRKAAQDNRERREAFAMKDLDAAKTHITEDFMQKHPQLKPLVTSTSDLQASVRRGEWDVEVAIPKDKLVATLNDSFPTLGMGDSLRSDPALKTIASLPAAKPEVLEQLLKESGFDGSALPLSKSIKAASGRYRPEHGSHYKTPRKRLAELKARTFDDYIKGEAPPTTLVVVCCGAGWLPQWRRVEPLLELLNGELASGVAAAAGASGSGGGAGAGAGGSGLPPFILRKFDMSESRFLRDRYNINTLPMYLMYYGGRLVYASSTLNGYGTSKDDLIAQVRESTAAALRGAFLPDDFRFGATDNNMTEKFASTLGATAPTLGK
jgi:hypothetical protein